MRFFAVIASVAVAVTPVQKVIQLLDANLSKGKQEKHDEEVRFAAFSSWCEDTDAGKAHDIKNAAARIEQLNADIAKADSDATVLGQEYAALQAQIGSWEADHKAASDIRAKEHGDYLATHQDYSESIDAIDRAVATLKHRDVDVKQAAALIQMVTATKKVNFAQARQLQKLLQEPDYLARSAPKANAYEFQSGGVVEMLEKLKDKFVEERRTLEKEETNARHSFEVLAQQLTDEIGAATATAADKSAQKAKREADSGAASQELADTSRDKAEDEKYLADLRTECTTKSRDFESRQTLRAGEIEAIEKAIEILGSDAVSGNADKHLPSLIQRAFVQTRAAFRSTLRAANVNKAVAYLQDKAHKSGSKQLAMIASAMSAGEGKDVFAKVKKMISEMIVKLQEDANAEAEQHGWCQTELATNKQTREEKTEVVEKLRARSDELSSEIATLNADVATLSDELAALAAALNEATKIRADEKAKNAVTVADAKVAQEAVAKAMAVLKEFYATAASATALVQQPSADAPATFDKPYQGMQAENGGVIGMLDVIQSDFARLETETSSSEAENQAAFEKFSAETAEDSAVKTTEKDHKTAKEARRQTELANTTKELRNTEAELSAAQKYYDDSLKPQCVGVVDRAAAYADRVQKRKEEIQSLQEALSILDSETV